MQPKYKRRPLCICAGTLFLNLAVEAASLGLPKGEPIFSMSEISSSLVMSKFALSVGLTEGITS